MEQIVVDANGNLNIVSQQPPAWLRMVAQIISYVFHPLILIGWIALYLLFVNDYVYMGAPTETKVRTFLSIFSSNIFLPLVTVWLLKGLGFVNSIQLITQKERIIPYVACITFFFWSYYVARNLHYPVAMQGFLLALFITASAGLMLNIYLKISMHALGTGGLMGLFVWLLFANQLNNGLWITLATAIAGITSTSRLLVSDHRPVEVYLGFGVGFILQCLAFVFV